MFCRGIRGFCGRDIVCRVTELVVVFVQQGRFVVLAQAEEDQLFDDIVDDREERDADDHAHEAPQAAEQQDGEQHPETGQAGGVARWSHR